MNKIFKTEVQFNDYFSSEGICLKHFEAIRFKDGDFCPHCGYKKIMRFSGGKRYRCYSCRKDFSIRTSTIFESSRLPLRTWFMVIYLLTTRKKGISSVELAERLGVKQRTAWFVDMRIRAALKQGGNKLFGDGIIEVDETYISERHTRKNGFRRKHVVMGMTERGGKKC